jgi:hypothetical protein
VLFVPAKFSRLVLLIASGCQPGLSADAACHCVTDAEASDAELGASVGGMATLDSRRSNNWKASMDIPF